MADYITYFCANEQAETQQTVDIDGNGEVVLTCECGRFLKMPHGTTGAELRAYETKHVEANEKQLSIQKLEDDKAALIEDIAADAKERATKNDDEEKA